MLVEESGALALIKGDWKYIEPHKGPKIFTLVNIASGYDDQPQLYYLKDDLAEKNNVAAENLKIVNEMAAELEALKSKGYRN